LEPLLNAVTGTSASVDTTRFAGGPARLRVVATDGVQSAFAETDPFTIPNKPPRARILMPGDGTRVQWGQLVNLSGDASDPQDGEIPASRVAWSDERGTLGTGPTLSLTDLPVGTHKLTFTATNSLGLSASASITLTVGDDLTLPGPTLTAGPMQIAWHVAAEERRLQTAEIAIGNSGSGNLKFTASVNASWMTLGATGGDAPTMLRLTADPSGFAPGATAEATLTLSADGIPHQVITIPVRLSVGNTFFGITPPVLDDGYPCNSCSCRARHEHDFARYTS
jgi:hypothetical protein